MTEDEHEFREELVSQAEIHAALTQIDAAIGELAARPLDEPAAERMREVLNGPKLKRARWVLAQRKPTPRPTTPRLMLVPPLDPDGGAA